jgi:hypothetical protein
LDIALFHVAVPYAGTDFYFDAVSNGWLQSNDWSRFDMNDSVVVAYDNLSSEAILAGTKRAFRQFYFRPRQVWRLSRMMAGGGDIGMIWSICKGFLSWLWRRKEDRVAPESAESKSTEGRQVTQLGVESARGALHGANVIEAPRTDLKGGKPSHRGYQSVTESGKPKDA